MKTLVAAFLSCLPAMSGTVYVVNDLARVRPSDPPGTVRKAVVKAARNEYAPFQVVLHGGAAGLMGASAAASELRGRSGRIPAANITLYREHYVEVKTPSPQSGEGAGWYPDALIPFAAKGGRFTGAPFDVAENCNQPVWVDLFVPKETAPGVYSGSITVTAQGEKPVRVPVELTVWPFTLPDVPTLRTSFGGISIRPPAGSPELRTAWRHLAEAQAAHKLSPPVPPYLYPQVNPDGSIDPSATHADLKEWVARYRLNGFPVHLLAGERGRGGEGSDPLAADRERNARYLRATYAYLKENGWEKMAYVYVIDEPNTAEAYERVRERARFIHETQPGLKVLCTEQPLASRTEWGTLVGSVDIWVPLWPYVTDKEVLERRDAGDEIWSYTALVQPGPLKRATPYWQLDFPLLNHRVPAWAGWRYGQGGLLYWATVRWDPAIDAWTDPLTFRKRFNLEGLLFYPGGDAGVDGLVASMRVKQIRESVEDHEYFVLARDKSIAAGVARSFFDWETDPARYYEARERLAQAIGRR